MTTLTLNLDPVMQLTDDAFYALCRANPEVKFERTAKGELVIVPPTGGETGNRNIKLSARLEIWADQDGTGLAFDSSTLFQLPNRAYRSPDAAWISLKRWEVLTPEEREAFSPICPDFVIELRSPSDNLKSVQDKMQEYMDNGARLGWLIDPKGKLNAPGSGTATKPGALAEIYRQGREKEILQAPTSLSGEEVLPGFVLDLNQIL